MIIEILKKVLTNKVKVNVRFRDLYKFINIFLYNFLVNYYILLKLYYLIISFYLSDFINLIKYLCLRKIESYKYIIYDIYNSQILHLL